MSKERTNRREDLKKVLGRNQRNKEMVPEPSDMQSQKIDELKESLNEEEMGILKFSGDNSDEVSLPKNQKKKQEYQPLSDEQKSVVYGVIREQWSKIKSKQELLSLLNLAITVLYGENAKKLTLRTLNYYAYSSNNKKRYITFRVPKKKKGEFRIIDAPCAGLKMIQRVLNLIFQLLYTPHQAAMGFVPHRSVVTNARLHVGQKYVYNIDLKDFFPSITSGRLFKRLLVVPFCTNEKVASIVTDLCCYANAEGKNVLPQGAPTSPTITNFICEHLDRKLSKLAMAYGMRYSRYADDITFSCMNNMFAEDGKFCKSLRNIIEEEEHLRINPDKTRLCHHGERQEVTGLTVNKRPNVSKKYIKQLRLSLHIWEAKGLPEAQRFFEKHYKPKTSRPNAGVPHIENVIAGKLLYLKMVKGGDDSTYMCLVKKWQKLEETMQNAKDQQEMYHKKNNGYYHKKNPVESSFVQELNEVLDTIIQSYG